MEYTITVNNVQIPVYITRKSMKTVRLKVFPSGQVCLSVPLGTTNEWIFDFVEKKQKWIAEKIILFKQTKATEKEEYIRSGVSTRMLGRQVLIKVLPATQKRILKDDDELIIYTTHLDNQENINRQFNNWWQRVAKNCFVNIMETQYPIVKKHGVNTPKIFVKKMSTLWGSCSRKHERINLNFYLYKAPLPCIEYVILHELIHFLYPRHNKDFYDFLTIHMPDWQERKKVLDYEIVYGV